MEKQFHLSARIYYARTQGIKATCHSTQKKRLHLAAILIKGTSFTGTARIEFHPLFVEASYPQCILEDGRNNESKTRMDFWTASMHPE